MLLILAKAEVKSAVASRAVNGFILNMARFLIASNDGNDGNVEY